MNRDILRRVWRAGGNPILTGLGVDQRFARNDTNGRAYYLTDQLGSTRGLTNGAGELLQRYD